MIRNKTIISLMIFLILILNIGFSSTIIAEKTLKNNDFLQKNEIINQNIIEAINKVNKSNVTKYLKELVNIGPRYTGSKNCKKAAKYIYEKLKDIGLYTYIQKWNYIRNRGENVIAVINGTDLSSDKVIIIFSHYDTITFPSLFPENHSQGANCGGSGIAILLAAAEVFSQYSFNHTIKFIAFSGEHVGCYGSLDYARKAYFKNENIYCAIMLDALGEANSLIDGKLVKISFQDRSTFLYNFTKDLCKRYKEHIDLDVRFNLDLPCNHYSFYKYGFDAIKFEQYASMENVDSPDDTIDKINFSYLTKMTKFITALGFELGLKPIDLQVRIITPLEDYIYFMGFPILKLPNFNFERTNYDGATIIFGSCKVKVNITSSDEIEKIVYSIDGLLHSANRENKTTWKIHGFLSPIIGKHKIRVYVFTKTGKIAFDEMDAYFLIFRFIYPIINPFWQKWAK